VMAGKFLGFTVILKDAFENPISTGTVSFDSSDDEAEFSHSSYTFISSTVSFSGTVKFKTIGDQTIIVEKTVDLPHKAEKTIKVTHAPIHHFGIEIIETDDIHAGAPFEIKITALDEFGNPVTDFTDTVSLGTDKGIAVTPSVTGNFVDGVWQGMIRVNEPGKVIITCDDGKGHTGETSEAKGVGTYTAIEKTFNYPNPFAAGNEDTNIQYYLEEPTGVEIRIYTLTGELVRKWEFDKGSEYGGKGVNLLVWDGVDKDGNIVGSGGYICAVDKKYDSGTKRDFTKIAVIRK